MPLSDWVSLASSNLSAYRYDGDTGRLEVRFTNGSTYSYAGVDPTVVAGLAAASSPGRFFHDNIKFAFDGTKE